MSEVIMLAKEAAELIGISVSTLHRRTDSGQIPTSYIRGGLRIYKEDDILAFKERLSRKEGAK